MLLIFHYNRISTVYLHEFFHYKVGYSQHNSCNGGIMYNIANILPTFCKVYLRLCPYFTALSVRLCPYSLFRIIIDNAKVVNNSL